MKTLLYTFMLSMLCVSLIAQKVTIKDASSNVLMEVNDEGKSGSITLLPDLAPLSTKNKLYNISNELYWDGKKLGTSLEAGGWTLNGSNLYPTSSSTKVGIGTTTPLFKMQIEGSTTDDVSFGIHNRNDAGSERLYFGESTSSDAGILVFGSTSTSAGKFRFFNNKTGSHYDWVSGAQVRMTLNHEGLMGIGTATPSAGMHVLHDNLEKTGYFQNNTTTDAAYGVYGEATNTGGIGHWGVYGTAGGATVNVGISGSASNGSNNYGGDFSATGTGSNYAIFANASGGATNYAGYFKNGDVVLENGKFGVRNTSPSAVVHITQAGTGDILRVDDISPDASPFVIQDDGDVGIGVASPTAKAHILQDLGGVDAFRVDDAVSDPSPFLIKSNGAIGVGTTLPMAKLHIIEESVNDAFRVDDAASDATPFVIKDDGSVGIGTASPGTKLHVDGYVTIDEKLVAGDDNGLKFCTNEQTTRMLIDDVGAVGIGTLSPAYNLHLVGTSAFQRTSDASPTSGSGLISTNGNTISASLANRSLTILPGPVIVYRYYGVRGEAHEIGAYRNLGVYGAASGAANNENWAGFFDGKVKVNGHQVINGDLTINGTISKTSGTFKIDHPLDPENKYLSHSFVESPDMMNVYNGNVTTNGDGRAEVILPHYFEALNKDFRYQLTVIGEFAQAIISKKISGNTFEIRTDKPHIEVSWQVTGIRQDAYANKNRVQVEEDKAAADRGTYLHPEAHGKPVEMREGYERMPN